MASTPHPPPKPQPPPPPPPDPKAAAHAAPPAPAKRSGPTVTPLHAAVNDAASLFKNGHRIAKEGDPPEKWISMGVLGDGTPVHQMPMTPEIEAEIKSGSYYLVDGLKEAGSGTPPAGPPVVVDKPYLEGVATVGSTLHCTQGNWTNSPTNKGYQYLRGGTPIAGAAAAAYTLVAADVGAKMTCEVTAVNAAGQASATSNEIGPVV